MSEKSYFSINYDLITPDRVIEYNLYVNSSSIKGRQKFIKVFKGQNFMDEGMLVGFRKKYPQLYVEEAQRSLYMKSLISNKSISDTETANFIKDSAIKYLHKIFDDEKEFSTELLGETISGCRDTVLGMVNMLEDYSIDNLRGLIGNLSSHDFYTYDHSVNVSMYCIQILRALKPNSSEVELMHAGLGGLLHDLGKVKIPTYILNSPGGLSDEDYGVIKEHPLYGIQLLEENKTEISSDINLDIISRVVGEHHENWNGTGYPNKLKENDIHLLSRVCTIADFFDAITTKRSYNEVLTVSKAIGVMEKFSGIKLDPKVFGAFKRHISHSKLDNQNDLKLKDSFDPTLPYSKIPLEKVDVVSEKESFGKIKILDDNKNKKEK